MILLHDPKKIYDPNAFENRVRRAMKVQMDRRYVEGRMTNKALKWLLSLPIVQYTITFMNKKMLENNSNAIEEIKKIEELKKEKVR